MNVDVAIVGGGPAGLSAAREVGRQGFSVVVLEEGSAPGGRFYGPLVGRNAARKQTEGGMALLASAVQAGARIVTSAAAWNATRVEGGFRVYVDGPGVDAVVESRAIVVAAGAYDRPHAFPGWTLPGVMTAGGIQQLVKRTGVVPGARIVLAGTGPFLLPVAATLIEHGVRPVAIVEAAPRSAWMRFAFGATRLRSHLREGASYGRAIGLSALKMRFGWQVTAAQGSGRIEQVVLKRSDGTPGEARIDCDALALGYGFLGQTELPALLGVQLRYDETQRQFLPNVMDDTSTEVPGVFLAGDGVRVRGYEAALHTGALAGRKAVLYLGKPISTKRQAEAVRRATAFGRLVTTTFPPPDPVRWAHADTILCRCEDVTYGEVEDAALRAADSVTSLKAWCRAGQGPCQSRTCGTLLAATIARARRVPEGEVGHASARPPIRPVSLGTVAASVTEGEGGG